MSTKVTITGPMIRQLRWLSDLLSTLSRVFSREVEDRERALREEETDPVPSTSVTQGDSTMDIIEEIIVLN